MLIFVALSTASLAGIDKPKMTSATGLYNMIQQGFIAQGINAWDAGTKAMAVLEGMISQQAAVLAFERSFFLIGALFFLCLPLIFMLKAAPRGEHAEPVEV